MCRYSVKAHDYGAYTVRDKYAGDILTFEFGDYLNHADASVDAHRVARALEQAYNQGIERGAREQRGYSSAQGCATRRGYPQGNTDTSRDVLERWREQHS